MMCYNKYNERAKETKTMMKIWFDMDGTIADLYAVDGWLEMLRNFDAEVYEMAKPLCRMCSLARQLNSLQRKGYTIGIISWSSKVSTEEFDEQVRQAKMNWLAQHLPSVNWDEVQVVPYGTPKHEVCGSGVLFDDEMHNRYEWMKHAGMAFEPEFISAVLSELGKC